MMNERVFHRYQEVVSSSLGRYLSVVQAGSTCKKNKLNISSYLACFIEDQKLKSHLHVLIFHLHLISRGLVHLFLLLLQLLNRLLLWCSLSLSLIVLLCLVLRPHIISLCDLSKKTHGSQITRLTYTSEDFS